MSPDSEQHVHGLGFVLPSFAIGRPVTVLMLLLATLVLGTIAWVRIPVQLMPSGFDFPYLWVWVPYPNSTPSETERLVLRPIEDSLETLPGVRNIESSASADRARLSIEFDQGVDMNEAYNGLVDRLERTRTELPDDLEDYFVYKYNPADDPILWAAISIPDGAADPAYLIETRVQKVLERVPGVARVEFNGANRSRIYVDFVREAVERHKVSLYEVMQKLQADNFTTPSGKLNEDGQVVYVRSLATVHSAEAIATMPIREDLVLEDIADVVHGIPASTTIHRVNGKNAASIDVYKESGANTIDVAQRMRKAIDDLKEDPKLAGFDVHRFFDQGDLIQESIDNLRDTALQGGALAIVVLFFFLRRLRVTVLIALSIPLSLLMAVVIQYARGGSVNILMLMGMMLAVGMTVDNSIVVVESIYRRRELGDDAPTAAMRGTAEVALAILAATMTTVVVFLPIILMTDDARFSFFMGEIGLPVCYALLCSLLVALVFVPLATLHFGGAPPAQPSRFVTWLGDRYAAALAWSLRNRRHATIIAVLLVASMQFPMNNLKRSDSSDGGIVDFVVRLSFPQDFTTREVDAALKQFEAVLEDKREEWEISAVRARCWGGSSRGFVMAFLESRTSSSVTKEEITEQLPELFPEIPGVEANVGWRRGEGSGGSTMKVRLVGDDSDRLVELGREVAERLSGAPGVLGAELELDEEGSDELHVLVDRERAIRYGVDPTVLGRTVSFAFRGSLLRPVVIDGREVPMQAGYQLSDRSNLRKLEDFPIWSPSVGEVSLATVADFRFAKGYGSIRRENRKTSLNVSVTFEDEDLGAGMMAINQALSGVNFPRGYGWEQGRRVDELAEQDAAQMFALLMSVAFVFLLMGMLFEDFWSPVAVLISIPFSLVGVYWMLWVTDTTFEMMAGIGLVILVGIVVNNAIVLIDRVQQHRQAGMERAAALVEAGRERFRPILMTAATTIVGLLPMAMGTTQVVGTPYFPLGRAVIGGLLVSTVLTLLLVPLVYTLIDDLKAMWGTAMASGAGVRVSAEQPAGYGAAGGEA